MLHTRAISSAPPKAGPSIAATIGFLAATTKEASFKKDSQQIFFVKQNLVKGNTFQNVSDNFN